MTDNIYFSGISDLPEHVKTYGFPIKKGIEIQGIEELLNIKEIKPKKLELEIQDTDIQKVNQFAVIFAKLGYSLEVNWDNHKTEFPTMTIYSENDPNLTKFDKYVKSNIGSKLINQALKYNN